jgi:excisionase family DNA binding protein
MMDGQTREARTPLAARLTITDVARILGVSERSVRRWVNQGKFPRPAMAGRLPRWSMVDIDDWERRSKNGKPCEVLGPIRVAKTG